MTTNNKTLGIKGYTPSAEAMAILKEGEKLANSHSNKGVWSSVKSVFKAIGGLLGLVTTESIGYTAHRIAENKAFRPITTDIRMLRRNRELTAELQAELELEGSKEEEQA